MENFDDVLLVTGKFGLYQWRTYFFVCITALVSCMLTFTQVFTGGTGAFWCEGSRFATDDCLRSDISTTECDKLETMSACMAYNFTFRESEAELEEYTETLRCDSWEFDHSVYQSTITEEWSLVCGRSSVTNILQSVYLSGFVLGCVGFGAMADRKGRYFTYIFCLVATALFALLTALSPNPIIFGALRFLVAACSYGSMLVAFVIGTEMVLPSTRVFVGVLLWYFYAFGYFVLSALGKFVSSWRLFIVLTVSPFILLVPAILYVDESPRWLLSKMRHRDAEKIIQKIAKVNGESLPPNFLSGTEELKEKTTTEVGTATIWDILRNPTLRLYLLNLLYNWFVQSFVYFGLSLGTSTLGVDVFIAFCISGAVEIPAYTFSAITMKYFGRKISTGGLMILAGVACFATIPAPPGPLRVVFAMIGKFAITSSFGNIYVHTAEIFPTPIRTLSVGTCSVAARVGGIIAPLILVLEKVWAPLPLVCFASSSIIAGLLVFFLPETKGKLMPDTIEDSVNLKQRTSSAESDAATDARA